MDSIEKLPDDLKNESGDKVYVFAGQRGPVKSRHGDIQGRRAQHRL